MSIIVFGSNGAIGKALINTMAANHKNAKIHAVSRELAPFSQNNVISHSIDYHSEHDLKVLAKTITKNETLDKIIVATGILHDEKAHPEKSISQISAEKLTHLFTVNTVVPSLIAKHFLSHLNKSRSSTFAALSARIGSISDNRLGGWYAYRASKAALNMMIRNYAIEVSRTNKNAIIVGLHPGTVDSPLSKPFQANVPEDKLFTPEYSATQLLKVLSNLTPADTGKCFAWDGLEIEP